MSFTLSCHAFSQTLTTGSPIGIPEIGWRYAPPQGLVDTTAADRQAVHDQAAARHTSNVLDVLLALRSQSSDSSKDWQRIGVQTYPREKLAGISDAEAMRKVVLWIAGPADSAEPKRVDTGGFHFLVWALQLPEGRLVRQGKVYATVSKGRIVVLSFTTNSEEVLNKIEMSVNSIQSLVNK